MPLNQLLDTIEFSEPSSSEQVRDNVDRILKAIRSHLNMEVAFASQVTTTETIIRYADTGEDAPFGAGDAFPVEDGYCKRVLEGRIPALIHEARTVAEVASLACTTEMPIGAHISVPLTLSDGSIYGTFCCFSFEPDYSLTGRDVEIMRAFADLAAGQIEAGLTRSARQEEAAQRISDVIDRDNVTIVYQPIYGLADNNIVGVEALSRFPDHSRRGPDEWFAEAGEVGLGPGLELAAIRAALRGLKQLPDDVYLAINVSPEVLLSGKVEGLVRDVPPGRLVLEVTEHAIINDFVRFRQAIDPLRGTLKIAVDDAGAGYSGLRHILDVRPDIIKLDMSLTRGVHNDPARAALASALVTFSREMGSVIVAEGVEYAGELSALKRLGADCAQGYHLQRPKPMSALVPFMIARQFGCSTTPRTDPMAVPEKPSQRSANRCTTRKAAVR